MGKDVERIGLALRVHEPGDDRRVDHAFAVHESAERVEQDGRIEDALLQQIAKAAGVCLDQAHRIGRLDVLRQNENRGSGNAGLDSCAATSPSSVYVGGIRMSRTAASGL